MKKLLLVLSLMLCFACDSSDDNNDADDHSRFHPPSWIRGTWYANANDLTGVRFTSDDFCNIITGTTECFKALIEQSHEIASVENESITDTDYKFTIEYGNKGGDFHYRKKSDTEIVLVVQGLETNIIYIKD
ncbi:hypothetical protein [Formosa sp. A9]|uniref:hypothetical protein n=1 Tax=Formosa sp. A9 TaxID=3442641 RepID=UPI003EBD3D2C